MANLTSPPIDWDGPEPTNASALVTLATIQATSHVHQPAPLVSPPGTAGTAGDPAAGYATSG